MKTIKDKIFDGSKLDSFIHRQYDRFEANEYANNVFTTKNSDIDTYCGASERMMYILNDDTICVPVIDRGDFDAVKVICMDSSGKIFIKELET